MAPANKHFKTEAELCAAFIAELSKDWTAYPETATWDILLVRKVDGFQIGVQAKLKLNAAVLAQSLDHNRLQVDSPRPDCRAVLVPYAAAVDGVRVLADYVGVTVIRVEPRRWDKNSSRVQPPLPQIGDRHTEHDWHEWAPVKRCKLPAYVPDVAAGRPSPVQLTDWKICALKLEIILEREGFLTRRDFRSVGVDHRRWLAPGTGWLRRDGDKFVPGPRFPNFKGQHPQAFEQIKADEAKWRKTIEDAQKGPLL